MSTRNGILSSGLVALALLTTGCAEAEDEDAVEDAAEESAADDQSKDVSAGEDLSGAHALLEEIYGPYTRDEFAETDQWFTADLARLIADPASGLADTEMGLGFDPFCACQDFGDVSYEIASVEAAGPGRARAEVSFTNFGETILIGLDLRQVDGRWLVDDLGPLGDISLREMAN